jgi:DNA polymerase-3 subunit epsilon
MRTWADGPMVAFDVETTGTDVENDRIVTASVVIVAGGGKPIVISWLADPGVEIPAGATSVHGITTEHAQAHGSPAVQVVAEVRAVLADAVSMSRPLVVFNAPYDLTLLDRECRRHGVPVLGEVRAPLRVIDPLVIDRATGPRRRGRRNLETVAALHGVHLSKEDAHTSAGDCLAAARVAWCQAHRTEVGALSLDELQVWQRGAHIDWADGFEAFLRTQGKGDVIDRSWPIRPYVALAAADGGMFEVAAPAPASGGLL